MLVVAKFGGGAAKFSRPVAENAELEHGNSVAPTSAIKHAVFGVDSLNRTIA